MPEFTKANVITDPAARERWKMAGDHGDRCQVCHAPWNRSGWRGLAVHHIIRGSNGRDDEPCNFLLLCADHHDACHDGQVRIADGKLWPAITLAMVLWVKSQTEEWNPERLEELYHRRLPDLEPLHPDYLREQSRW